MASVYLVGFMGSGKTTVGRALAASLCRHFVDLDELLCEAFSTTISEIFARRGSEAFLRAEAEALRWTTIQERLVVATSAGTFCRPGNRQLIFESGGVAVYLELPWELLTRRLMGKTHNRPSLNAEEAYQLFAEREPLYRLAQHMVSPVGEESPAQVAARIVGLLGSDALVDGRKP